MYIKGNKTPLKRSGNISNNIEIWKTLKIQSTKQFFNKTKFPLAWNVTETFPQKVDLRKVLKSTTTKINDLQLKWTMTLTIIFGKVIESEHVYANTGG